MNKRVEDISGQRFGRLQVVDLAGTDRLGSKWNCVCDCGNLVVAYRYKLVAGEKKSCGCLWRRSGGKYVNQKHPLEAIRNSLIQRCRNPRRKDYRYYGAKGIRVCAEWDSAFEFKRWAYMAGYLPWLSIDRTDPDGDYCPENCRWVSKKENCRRQQHERTIQVADRQQEHSVA